MFQFSSESSSRQQRLLAIANQLETTTLHGSVFVCIVVAEQRFRRAIVIVSFIVIKYQPAVLCIVNTQQFRKLLLFINSQNLLTFCAFFDCIHSDRPMHQEARIYFQVKCKPFALLLPLSQIVLCCIFCKLTFIEIFFTMFF